MALDKTQSFPVRGIVLIVVAAVVLALPVSSPAQVSSAPLKDVCADGWARYLCVGTRLCVSPEVENKFHPAEILKDKGCVVNDDVIPEEWTHATWYEVGWTTAAGIPFTGYRYCARVVRLGSSTTESEIKTLDLYKGSDWNRGWHEYGPVDIKSLKTYGLNAKQPPADAKDVCPVNWSRYSCQFVRLCVSPTVTNRFNVQDSSAFKKACGPGDGSVVPQERVWLSAHDVGVAAGVLLLGPRYVKAVMIDSSDIIDGDINEAIKRLVLVPIPANYFLEFHEGEKEGNEKFEQYLTKNREKNSASH